MEDLIQHLSSGQDPSTQFILMMHAEIHRLQDAVRAGEAQLSSFAEELSRLQRVVTRVKNVGLNREVLIMELLAHPIHNDPEVAAFLNGTWVELLLVAASNPENSRVYVVGPEGSGKSMIFGEVQKCTEQVTQRHDYFFDVHAHFGKPKKSLTLYASRAMADADPGKIIIESYRLPHFDTSRLSRGFSSYWLQLLQRADF